MSDAEPTSIAAPASDKWVPYRHPQPKDSPPELVVPNAIPTDERIWVPVEENVWFRPLLLAAVGVGVGSSIWWSFCVDAMRDAGVGATTARLVYAGCGAAGVLASLTGVLVQRTGQRRAHQATVLGVAASLALLAVLTGAAAAVGAHLAPPVTTALVVLAAVTFGVTYNGVVAVQGMWSAAVFAERPSAGLAAVNTSLTVGTLVGPALGGFVIALSGYGPALALAALLTALALPLAPPAPAAARTARSAVETGSVRTNASTG